MNPTPVMLEEQLPEPASSSAAYVATGSCTNGRSGPDFRDTSTGATDAGADMRPGRRGRRAAPRAECRGARHPAANVVDHITKPYTGAVDLRSDHLQSSPTVRHLVPPKKRVPRPAAGNVSAADLPSVSGGGRRARAWTQSGPRAASARRSRP